MLEAMGPHLVAFISVAAGLHCKINVNSFNANINKDSAVAVPGPFSIFLPPQVVTEFFAYIFPQPGNPSC